MNTITRVALALCFATTAYPSTVWANGGALRVEQLTRHWIAQDLGFVPAAGLTGFWGKMEGLLQRAAQYWPADARRAPRLHRIPYGGEPHLCSGHLHPLGTMADGAFLQQLWLDVRRIGGHDASRGRQAIAAFFGGHDALLRAELKLRAWTDRAIDQHLAIDRLRYLPADPTYEPQGMLVAFDGPAGVCAGFFENVTRLDRPITERRIWVTANNLTRGVEIGSRGHIAPFVSKGALVLPESPEEVLGKTLH